MMQRIVRLLGGPLDGTEVDVTGWMDEDISLGAYHFVDGWDDERADYSPAPGAAPLRWLYRGPVTA